MMTRSARRRAAEAGGRDGSAPGESSPKQQQRQQEEEEEEEDEEEEEEEEAAEEEAAESAGTPPPPPYDRCALLAPYDLKDIQSSKMCAEYAADITEYHFEHEKLYPPNPQYISAINHDISQHMRSILVDWLVEVAEEYRLQPETLFLCINLLDRSLSMFAVQRQKLQLLGCAVMLLASKYEEIYAPPVDDFVYISDSTYTKEEVLGMERQVLDHLQFRLTVSTQWTFLQRFLKVAVSGEQEKFLSRYLLELALLSYGMIKYHPSEIAAAALNLGRQTLRVTEPWPEQMVSLTSYSASELEPCVQDLHALHQGAEAAAHQAVRSKYSHEPYEYVGMKRAIDASLLVFA